MRVPGRAKARNRLAETVNKRSNLRVHKLPKQRHLLLLHCKTKEPRDLDNNHPSLMKTGGRSRTRDNVQRQRPLLLLQTKEPLNLDSNQSLGVKINVKSRTRDNVQKQRPLLLLQTKKPLNLGSNQSMEVKTNVKG